VVEYLSKIRFKSPNLLKTIRYTLLAVVLFAVSDGILGEFSYDFKNGSVSRIIGGALTFLLLVIAFLPFFLQKTSPFKRIFYIFTAACLSVTWAFRFTRGSSFTAQDALLLITEYGFANEAAQTFLKDFLLAIAIASFIITLLWIFSKQISDQKTFLKILPTAAIFGAILYIVLSPTASFIRYFPSFLKVPSAFASAVFKTPESTFRAAPTLPFKNNSAEQHIIFIIDESIRGDEISINSPNIPTTPFLKSIEADILNFGIMSSSTNCSSTANLILRTGLQPKNIPDESAISLKKADIFAYAKAAGFTTFYLDGQSQSGALPNYLAQSDLKNIDNLQQMFLKNTRLKPAEIDTAIATELATITHSPFKTFTLVNKWGAHFHYGNSYPSEQQFLKPKLSNSGGFADKTKLLNSYRNAVRWSVDEFFKKLLSEIDRKKTLIIYTSDHGQSLMESRATNPHCQLNDVPREQATVPFFIIAPQNEIFKNELFKNALQNKNRLSHFTIFPTILLLFGFEKTAVNSTYGATIFDSLNNRQRYFYSGDIFGHSPLRKNPF
jgi:glucan phosphoethanolaminetransferase (alkaline phosphatase superfamily)